MSENEIIFFFVDTNVLCNKKINYDILNEKGNINQIIKLRDLINQNIPQISIRIVFPDIVMRELKTQKLELLVDARDKAIETLSTLIPEPNASDELQKIYRSTNQVIESSIDSKISEYTHENGVDIAIRPDDSYFSKIIDIAIKKEKPFKKNESGFKDALIWFSIEDYLVNYKESLDERALDDVSTPELKRSYLFTDNQIDFNSSALKQKLFEKTEINLKLVVPPFSKHNTPELRYISLIKEILSDINDIQILNINVGYEIHPNKIWISQILIEPYFFDFSYYLRIKEYNSDDWQERARKNIGKLLKELGYRFDESSINVEFSELQAIDSINIGIVYQKNGDYYEIPSIEIEYFGSDNDEFDPQISFIEFEDIISNLHSNGSEDIRLSSRVESSIISTIENRLSRKIDSGLFYYYYY